MTKKNLSQKFLVLMVLLLFSVGTASAAAPVSESDVTIAGIGIGDSLVKAISIFKSDMRTERLKDDPNIIRCHFLDNKTTIYYHKDYENLIHIEIRSSQYKTIRDITTGMTANDVEYAYGGKGNISEDNNNFYYTYYARDSKGELPAYIQFQIDKKTSKVWCIALGSDA